MDLLFFRCPRRAVETEAAELEDEVADCGTVGSGVHPQSAAEGAGDSGEAGDTAVAEFRRGGGELGQSEKGACGQVGAPRLHLGEHRLAEPDSERGAGGVTADEIGPAADDQDRNGTGMSPLQQSAELAIVAGFGEERQCVADAEGGDFTIGEIVSQRELRKRGLKFVEVVRLHDCFLYTFSGSKSG